MSDLASIRGAIVDKLNTVSDIGLVHGHQRYATRNAELSSLYVESDRLLGWHVRRVSTRESSEELGRWVTVHRWEIRGFMALEDADQTELLFDALIEQIRTAFREDDSLGDLVDSCIVGQEAGIQVQDSGPVMFAGVLCHSARLALNTRVYL